VKTFRVSLGAATAFLKVRIENYRASLHLQELPPRQPEAKKPVPTASLKTKRIR